MNGEGSVEDVVVQGVRVDLTPSPSP
jgi:hypothetical protein